MNKGESTKARKLRAKIIQFLTSKDQCTFTDIKKAVGINTDSNTCYHLKKLLEFGTIYREGDIYRVSKRAGGSYHYLEVFGCSGKLIERISLRGLSPLLIAEKKEKIKSNIPFKGFKSFANS
jgi:hypothetical protein